MEEPSIPNPKQSKKILWDQYVILVLSMIALAVLGGLGLTNYLLTQGANKCCGSEAKTNVGGMNHAQQVYFLDHGRLASSLKELDFSMEAETQDYSYSTVNFGQHVFNYARSKRENRRSVVGGVFIAKLPEFDELSTLTIMCEAKYPETQPIQPPINAKTCGAGTEKVN